MSSMTLQELFTPDKDLRSSDVIWVCSISVGAGVQSLLWLFQTKVWTPISPLVNSWSFELT